LVCIVFRSGLYGLCIGVRIKGLGFEVCV
jgi:hypothetical protein